MPRELTDLYLILAWLAAPALILVALTLLWRPTLLPRYILHSTVALYILMGAGAAAIQSKGRRRAVICLLVGFYAYDTAAFGIPRRPNLCRAVEIVQAQPLPEGDVVFAHPSGYGGPTRWYSDYEKGTVESVRDWKDLPDKAQALVDEGKGCWILVGSLMGTVPDIRPQLRDRGIQFDYELLPGAFPLRVYHIKREAQAETT